jgi:hypothetical protein
MYMHKNNLVKYYCDAAGCKMKRRKQGGLVWGVTGEGKKKISHWRLHGATMCVYNTLGKRRHTYALTT